MSMKKAGVIFLEKFISSTANPYIKHLKKLQTSSKYRNEQGKFLLEGLRPIKDAITAGNIPEKVLVSESFKGSVTGAEVIRITDSVARVLSDTVSTQGIMAEIKMPKSNISELTPGSAPTVFFCDGVSDPGNLGTIIRTLEAVGNTRLILGKGTVDLYNPKTVRSTMSAIFNLPIYFAEDSVSALEKLKQMGYKIAGTRMENATLYWEQNMKEPTVIVLGNEANGISGEVMNLCDEFIKIPINGKAESLNVAVAASVIAYETVRQRSK